MLIQREKGKFVWYSLLQISLMICYFYFLKVNFLGLGLASVKCLKVFHNY